MIPTPVSALKNALITARLQKGRLLCAVSGGADSVALLCVAHELCGELPLSLSAVHVQHGLRGENSRQDEMLVRSLCRQWNIPLQVMNANLRGTMQDPGMETLARNERRRLFTEAVRAAHADALLLAHHRDDQAETVLMHLLRGAGLEGLCGMRVCAPFEDSLVLRPFLNMSKQELKEYLLSKGISWREDESNGEMLTPRNRLRLDLLPRLEALYPGATAHLALTAGRLRRDEDCLAHMAQKVQTRCVVPMEGVCALYKAPLLEAEEALVVRVLRAWALAASDRVHPLDERGLDTEDTEALLALLHGEKGECLNLPNGLKAECGRLALFLLRQDGSPIEPAAFQALNLPQKGQTLQLPSCRIQVGESLPSDGIPASPREAVLSPEILRKNPVFRFPEPEDSFRPLGAPGAKSLLRYFTDRQVDRPFRSCLCILVSGHEVLWVPGMHISEALRLKEPVRDGIRLTLAQNPPYLP